MCGLRCPGHGDFSDPRALVRAAEGPDDNGKMSRWTDPARLQKEIDAQKKRAEGERES